MYLNAFKTDWCQSIKWKKKPMITNIKIEVIKNQNSDIYDQREYLLSGESRWHMKEMMKIENMCILEIMKYLSKMGLMCICTK